MKQAHVFIVVLAVALLSGCDWSLMQPRYQLITATDGKIYRLDIKTGTVHYVTPSGMLLLTDHVPILRVGEYYQMDDAKDDTKFLKYLGNGGFEKGKWAIRKELQ